MTMSIVVMMVLVCYGCIYVGEDDTDDDDIYKGDNDDDDSG